MSLHVKLRVICNWLLRAVSFRWPQEPLQVSSFPPNHPHCTLTPNPLTLTVQHTIVGSIGVGAAYPLDAIKTKSQVAAAQRSITDGNSLGMVGMFRLVIQEEGIGGLYGGVKGVMFGQAFIKALAFSSNNWALTYLEHDNAPTSLEVLIAAAAFSGFVTSFLVNPIERIKILMQADNQGMYKNEMDCMKQIIQQDGMKGLLGRGLDATLAREVPGYGLYFVAYSLLIQSEVGHVLGQTLAPLICGAAAGCISWIPVSIPGKHPFPISLYFSLNISSMTLPFVLHYLQVYPLDVIKTAMQNTQGGQDNLVSSVGKPVMIERMQVADVAESISESTVSSSSSSSSTEGSFMQTAQGLYNKGGVSIFFDGLSPKMLRAAVNHAVTFFTYDLLLHVQI